MLIVKALAFTLTHITSWSQCSPVEWWTETNPANLMVAFTPAAECRQASHTMTVLWAPELLPDQWTPTGVWGFCLPLVAIRFLCYKLYIVAAALTIHMFWSRNSNLEFQYLHYYYIMIQTHKYVFFHGEWTSCSQRKISVRKVPEPYLKLEMCQDPPHKIKVKQYKLCCPLKKKK